MLLNKSFANSDERFLCSILDTDSFVIYVL